MLNEVALNKVCIAI